MPMVTRKATTMAVSAKREHTRDPMSASRRHDRASGARARVGPVELGACRRGVEVGAGLAEASFAGGRDGGDEVVEGAHAGRRIGWVEAGELAVAERVVRLEAGVVV